MFQSAQNNLYILVFYLPYSVSQYFTNNLCIYIISVSVFYIEDLKYRVVISYVIS